MSASGPREGGIGGIQTLLKCFQICLDYLKQKEVREKLYNKTFSRGVYNKSGTLTRKQLTTINKHTYNCSGKVEGT